MKRILQLMAVAIFFAACENKTEVASEAGMTKDTAAQKPPAEFADAKYVEMGKTALQQFANGDYDAWSNILADDAVYSYSAGDSIAGKQAIIEYWKNRRAKVIESMTASKDIWVPLKVNKSQQGPDQPGNWLLNWHQVTAKYKSGKEITFWVHTLYHFNDADKADRVYVYVDRSIINAAAAGK